MKKRFTVGDAKHLSLHACLNCGKPLDAASEVAEKPEDAPKPGCVTLCAYCGHIMVFADDMSFRELTDEEITTVAGDERIVAVSNAIAKRLKEYRDT